MVQKSPRAPPSVGVGRGGWEGFLLLVSCAITMGMMIMIMIMMTGMMIMMIMMWAECLLRKTMS